MLEPKYMVRVGANRYGTRFQKSYWSRDEGLKYNTSTQINDARMFDNLSTAKAMGTRLRNILLDWARLDVHNDPRPFEPIDVVEVNLTAGPAVQSKKSVVPEV